MPAVLSCTAGRLGGLICPLIPEVSAGGSYDFDIDDRIITAAFEGSPGAVFGCGLTLMASNGISTSLEYKGEYRDSYQSHGVMGLLRVSF